MDEKHLKLIQDQQSRAAEIAKQIHLKEIFDVQKDFVQINYTLENLNTEDIFVLDHILCFADKEGFTTAKSAAIQIQDKDFNDNLNILKGYVSAPYSDVSTQILPAARILKAKSSIEGSCIIKLPLNEWHPNEGVLKIKKQPRKLLLQVGILPNFCELTTITLEDNSICEIPKSSEAYLYQQWIKGSLKKI